MTDKVGRRFMFLATMVMFIVFGLAQSFVTSIEMLVIIRFILGMPLGCDVATGYTYIMECMPKGQREVMGGRWMLCFSVGTALALAFILAFLLLGMPHYLVWRVTLGLGALPAVIILWLRSNLPETAMWLVRQGRFREAKQASLQMYNDNLDMLPDQDIAVRKPGLTEFLTDTRKDPIRWRATLYGWISLSGETGEFATFGFYLPVLFVMVGVSSIIGINVILMFAFMFGAVGAWVVPLITPKIGHRNVGKIGFGGVLISLLVAAAALYTGHVYILPFAAATLLWTHYCAASNTMVIPTMVAKPEYRGTAAGFSYMFSKLTAFLSIFLFPSLFAAIGQANSTLLCAIFPLAGLLAAIFILPEVYGFEQS
jgi:MFS family permease